MKHVTHWINGKPWDGPWAMAYPNGTVPTTEEVHPTPVYETITMLLVAALVVTVTSDVAAPTFRAMVTSVAAYDWSAMPVVSAG